MISLPYVCASNELKCSDVCLYTLISSTVHHSLKLIVIEWVSSHFFESRISFFSEACWGGDKFVEIEFLKRVCDLIIFSNFFVASDFYLDQLYQKI
jgi:hypothetical protein